MRSVLLRGLVILVLAIPAFSLMLRFGIYTMHDPHIFRIIEFHNCISAGTFPCRWAADSGKGYGEPLFNFYNQLPYWLSEILIFSGFSVLDSAKTLFILSLVLSGFAMFAFAKKYWGPAGGLVTAVFYIYAPYRAVDVWVRGALPEALSFIFYPLIFLTLDNYLDTRKSLWLAGLVLSLSALITTHNLSFFMFAPFLLLYYGFRSLLQHSFLSPKSILFVGLLTLGLSAYYLLPVIFESRLVTLSSTVRDYYDYHIHFTTLHELFISRFWGYGASLWARKYLSVSAGQLHWIIPALLSLLIILKRRLDSRSAAFIFFTGCGLLALFLTHGKSSFIWNFIPFMKYVQFPWRYLSMAAFFLSLASGYIANLFKNRFFLNLIITLIILINFNFFRPDIWRSVSDAEVSSGSVWDEGRSSSLGDFWPASSPQLPTEFAPESVIFSGQTLKIHKLNTRAEYVVRSDLNVPQPASLPIVYFPGWRVWVNQQLVSAGPAGNLGLITFNLPPGESQITAVFGDTPVRTLGNVISFLSLFFLPIWLLKKHLG
jgi:hypothetical protein